MKSFCHLTFDDLFAMSFDNWALVPWCTDDMVTWRLDAIGHYVPAMVQAVWSSSQSVGVYTPEIQLGVDDVQ